MVLARLLVVDPDILQLCLFCFFFFQAEDGIRDHCVTGVQTCALPICRTSCPPSTAATCCPSGAIAKLLNHRDARATVRLAPAPIGTSTSSRPPFVIQIGRASCRERV